MVKNALLLELLNVWTHVWSSRIWFFFRIKCNGNGDIFIFIKLVTGAGILFITKSLSKICWTFNPKKETECMQG